MLAFGCDAEPQDSLWGTDRLWLAARTGETYGFHTWNIYDASWRGSSSEKHHICSLVVPISARPILPCETCIFGWHITPGQETTDCEQHIITAGNWRSLQQISFASTGSLQVPMGPEHGLPVLVKTQNKPEWEPYGWYESPTAQDLEIISPWIWQIAIEQ